MRALITGGSGQLGRALVATCPSGVDLMVPSRVALDITSPESVHAAVESWRPEVILNSAAYTAVDHAEDEPDQAHLVNSVGPGNLAATGIRVVQVSTDFVFGGTGTTPFLPSAHVDPLSEYGRSKRGGELAVLRRPIGTVVRTVRVFSSGSGNFVTSLLDRLRHGGPVEVVDDQVGAPTWAVTLARVLWQVATLPEEPTRRILHWTDAGECSHHEWAVAIRDEALRRGMLDAPVRIEAVSSSELGAAAIRPAYSTLDCSETVELVKIAQRPWRETLGTMLDEMVVAARNGKA